METEGAQDDCSKTHRNRLFEIAFPCSLVQFLAYADLLQCRLARLLSAADCCCQGKASLLLFAVAVARPFSSRPLFRAAAFDWLGLRQISTPFERTLSAAR